MKNMYEIRGDIAVIFVKYKTIDSSSSSIIQFFNKAA